MRRERRFSRRALMGALLVMCAGLGVLVACGTARRATTGVDVTETDTAPAAVLAAGAASIDTTRVREGFEAIGMRDVPENVLATLSTIEKLDDYPVYTMRYFGPYIRSSELTPTAPSDAASREHAWACSLFAAVGDAGQPVFGRNFDWEYSPILVIHLEPETGHRSVMSIDLAYLVDAGTIAHLDTAPVESLLPLLSAPFLTFDGMNDTGLSIAMASVDYECGYPTDPDKRDVGDLRMMREVLESSATVEEAIAFLEGINPVSQGGPNTHYLLADRTAAAALIEYHDGEMYVFQSNAESPWKTATNFPVVLTEGDPAGSCWRYDRIEEALRDSGGSLSPAEAMRLLQAVSTSMTQWSIVYDLANAEMHLVVDRSAETVHTFSLPREAADTPAGATGQGNADASAHDALPGDGESASGLPNTAGWTPVSTEVTGRLSEIDGVPVLHVWGTPREQGYAIGHLLAPEIVALYDRLIAHRTWGLDPGRWNNEVLAAAERFTIAPGYIAEFEGMLSGIESRAGGPAEVPALGRSLRVEDLVAASYLYDDKRLGCTSFAVWGAMTEDGRTLYGRNMDWPSLPAFLEAQQIVIVRAPWPGSRRKATVSVFFPLVVGVNTAMNEDGVVLCNNDAYNERDPVRQSGFFPAPYSNRTALETARSASAVQDILAALWAEPSGVGRSLTVATPAGDGEGRGVVFEADGIWEETGGVTVRAPEPTGSYILTTMHHRQRGEPIDCPYYDIGEQAFRAVASGDASPLTVATVWDLLTALTPTGGLTYHSVIFEPDRMLMHVRLQDDGVTAQRSRSVTLDVDALFQELLSAGETSRPCDEAATIAFDSDRDGDVEIYSVSTDGSPAVRLTDRPGADLAPTWSPDGAWIAFSTATCSYVMGLDTGELRQLPPSAQLNWSPDGTEFVYVAWAGDDAEIFVMDARGGNVRQLTHNDGGDFEPVWLPDGEHIGWSSDANGPSDIYVMRSNGTDVTQLTDTSDQNAYPHWSPDGTRVVFCSDRTGNWEIYTMNADGTDVKQLTFTDAFNGAPRWSPDGTRIAFESDRDGDSDIYVMNADGSGVRQLTENDASDRRPCWRPSTRPDGEAGGDG